MKYFINLIEHEIGIPMKNSITNILRKNGIVSENEFINKIKNDIELKKILNNFKNKINLNNDQTNYIINLLYDSQSN